MDNYDDKRNHYSHLSCHSRISASSDFADERIHKYLTFVLWCRSNDLVAEQDYSKRQFIVLRLIQTLQSEGMGYRKIAKKLNEWGIKTHTGKTWFNTSVHSVIKRYGQREERIEKLRHKKYKSKLSKMKMGFVDE